MIKKICLLSFSVCSALFGMDLSSEISLAARITAIKPSPTLAISKEASQRKKNGEDIISLAVGEPDFDTPDHIKQAAWEAMQNGQTKYTAVDGMPELKLAIQHKFKQDNDLAFDVTQIMVSTGGKQVIYNALMATCEAGDDVLIPTPYWVSYPDMVKLCDANPVFVECLESDGFKLTAESLERGLTPQTKWVILNSPSNPTGSVYTREELRALGDVLKRHGCYIMSDDIYEYLTYEGEFVNLPMVCPDLQNRCLIVNGLSKSYAMTGWRMGYGAGPKRLIDAMTILQSQSTSNPCSIAQCASIKALTSPRDFLQDWRKSFMDRRDYCLERLNAIEGLSCRKAEGAFYLYVNSSNVMNKITPMGKMIHSDMDFAKYLLDTASVAVVPGSAFGLSPFFRISYATSMDELKRGCDRIEMAVKQLT